MHRDTPKPAWLEYSVSKRDTTVSFDFDFVKLGVALKTFKHETFMLSCKIRRGIPQLVSTVSAKELEHWTKACSDAGASQIQEKDLLVDINENLHILPLYPTRPLVLHYPKDLLLCPASETVVFAVSLVNTGLFRGEAALYTWDTIQTPKKTLYGEPSAGIIANTFEEAFMEQEAEAEELARRYPLCVLHPLHILNKSGESIAIKDLLINYPQLSIYEHNGYLTSERIRYEIGVQRIAISAEAQTHLKTAHRIQKPAVSEPNFVLQGFQLFRNMVGF